MISKVMLINLKTKEVLILSEDEYEELKESLKEEWHKVEDDPHDDIILRWLDSMS